MTTKGVRNRVFARPPSGVKSLRSRDAPPGRAILQVSEGRKR